MRHALCWLAPVVMLAGCGSPTINVVDPFAAVNWSPHDGATCVDPDWSGLRLSVCLNRDVDAASAAAHAALHVLEASGEAGAAVTATVAVSTADAACIEFQGPELADATDYVMVLGADLEAADGTVLDHRLMSRFRTIDASCN